MPDRLAELKALAEKATKVVPGEVVYDNDTGPSDEGFWEWYETSDGTKFDTKEDAEFYSHARESILSLIAELEAARQPKAAGTLAERIRALPVAVFASELVGHSEFNCYCRGHDDLRERAAQLAAESEAEWQRERERLRELLRNRPGDCTVAYIGSPPGTTCITRSEPRKCWNCDVEATLTKAGKP